MRLYLVRHAWAGEADSAKWPNDADRPLTDDGKKRFRKTVEALVERGFAPAVIATSPYVRARQTAEIIAKLAPFKPEIVLLEALEPSSRLDEALAWTGGREEEKIAWVGHMPDLTLLAAELIDGDSAHLDFSKGATAAIDFEGPPAAGVGTLRWLVTAKMLGC